MHDDLTRMQRLYAYWVYGAGLSGLLLVVLAPVLMPHLHRPAALCYLALPVYMIHQYEEHDADRFRIFVNQMLGPKSHGLSRADVFVINVILVWGSLSIALYLSNAGIGFGSALAAWLLLFNALVHIGQALALKRYNPGLVTAIILFIPLGLALALGEPLSLGTHALALGLVIALHIGIALRAKTKLKTARDHA